MLRRVAHSLIASGSNIGFLPPYPSIHISKPSELPTSNLSERGCGSWGSHTGVSHYQSSEVAPIALASLSQAYNAPGSFPVELSHLSVSASLSGSEGMQRRGLGDDRLLPHGSSSRDSRPDDTSYRPRKYLPHTQHSLTWNSGVFFPGAPPRIVGFMDTPPGAPPIDAISHCSTHDQSPGLHSRRSSAGGLGLVLPAHHEYTRSGATSSQSLDMKPPAVSHSFLRNNPVPNSSPTIGDMYVHINYRSVALLIVQQAILGPFWSLGEPRTWK